MCTLAAALLPKADIEFCLRASFDIKQEDLRDIVTQIKLAPHFKYCDAKPKIVGNSKACQAGETPALQKNLLDFFFRSSLL